MSGRCWPTPPTTAAPSATWSRKGCGPGAYRRHGLHHAPLGNPRSDMDQARTPAKARLNGPETHSDQRKRPRGPWRSVAFSGACRILHGAIPRPHFVAGHRHARAAQEIPDLPAGPCPHSPHPIAHAQQPPVALQAYCSGALGVAEAHNRPRMAISGVPGTCIATSRTQTKGARK